VFIPALVPLKQIDADNMKGHIMYEGGITNGKGATASKDLWKAIEDHATP
jgi:hypothetical protein